MRIERRIWFIDRFGREFDDDVTVEAFIEMFDDVVAAVDDAEHCVVDICDSTDWYVEFSRTTVTLGQAEVGGEHLGDLPLTSREEAIAIAREFLGAASTLSEPDLGWPEHH
ncbi:hypothetical protein SAMN04489740_4193 [Arthrobacter alpinus]|uniref:Uncharacterized protein n=1 Tax=Arthrobacter alpinus TaxID=656366 RepID=A0A1H5PEW3_9MICC|nr:hypothetical protein [Arthrobacter alpinus]SEF12154.1 hypothetical protein SAMN04489740_4193 [Arthrobacter alpinus]